jgi:hypothetical protein
MSDEEDPLKFDSPDPCELLATDPAECKKEEAPAETKQEDDGLDKDETFASPEAPWVGQEQAWIERGGVDPEPRREETPVPDLETLKRFSSTPPPAYASLVDVKADLPSARPLPAYTSIVPPPAAVSFGLKVGIAAVALVGVVVIALGAVQITNLRGDREQADKTIGDLTSELRLRNQMIEGMRLASKRQAEFLKARIERLARSLDPVDLKRADDLAQLFDHERNDVAALSNELLKVDLSRRAKEPAVAEAETPSDNRDRAGRREGERDTEAGGRGAGGAKADDNPYAGLEPVAEAQAPSVSGHAVGTGKSTAELDDLIDNALSKRMADKADGAKQEAPMPMPGGEQPSGAPTKPSRDQVQTAMNGIASQVKACAQGQQGKIVVKVTVQGATGRVTAAEVVDPEHAGTPAGVCAARAARLAKFPSFSDDSITIKYPFAL